MYNPDREFDKPKDVREGRAIEIPCKGCGKIGVFYEEDEPTSFCYKCTREEQYKKNEKAQTRFADVCNKFTGDRKTYFLQGYLASYIKTSQDAATLDKLSHDLEMLLDRV